MSVYYVDVPDDSCDGAYIYNNGQEIVLISRSLKGTAREQEILSRINNGDLDIVFAE